ncbi:MAG: hypothetical protein ACRDVK_08105, partial [Acidimicrobiia bacterium]
MASLAKLVTIPVEQVKGVAAATGIKLRKQGIRSVGDLIGYFPRRHIDRSRLVSVAFLPIGEEVTVVGTVTRSSIRRPKK